MRCSTTVFAACAVLLSVLCPQVAQSSPMIKVEGRDLASRFVPPVHPVFPRTYWDNEPKVPTPVKDPVTPVKRHVHPPGPTASNWIYRSEPYVHATNRYEKDWKKEWSGKAKAKAKA